MPNVTLTVTLEESDYAVLLNAAVMSGIGTPEFVRGLITTYLEDNYGPV